MNKLEEYLKYEYIIEVMKLSDDCSGGYIACIPQLGRFAFIGDGETEQEAIDALKEVKKNMFEIYIEKDIEPPLPLPTGLYKDIF